MKNRRYRIKWFKLIVLAITGYFIYNCVSQQVQLNAIEREAQATKIQIDKLQEQNKQLNEERARLTTPNYVEKLAREELGLVKPGEMPYFPVQKK